LSDKPELLLDTQLCNLKLLKDQSKAFHVDELQQIFSVLSRTEVEMKRSSLAQIIFEMSILRLADVRPFYHIDDMIEAINTMEEAQQPELLPSKPVNLIKDKPIKLEPVELSPDKSLNIASNWEKIKQEICARKTVFNHYLAQCTVLVFDESNLDIGFVDAITLDQVKNSENLKLVKDVVKLICNREMNVTLVLSDKAKNPIANSSSNSLSKKGGKKINFLNQNQDKSEIEIIQNALDVFGGEVIK